jgi:hypothetical protein
MTPIGYSAQSGLDGAVIKGLFSSMLSSWITCSP